MATTPLGFPLFSLTDDADIAAKLSAISQKLDSYLTARNGTFVHNAGLNITVSTGWGSLDYYWQVKFGMLFARFQVIRTGVAITAPASGNITNSQLFTLNDTTYWPPTQVSARAYCTATGGSSTLQPNGIWTLTDMNPTSTVNTGDFVSTVFNYPVSV